MTIVQTNAMEHAGRLFRVLTHVFPQVRRIFRPFPIAISPCLLQDVNKLFSYKTKNIYDKIAATATRRKQLQSPNPK